MHAQSSSGSARLLLAKVVLLQAVVGSLEEKIERVISAKRSRSCCPPACSKDADLLH